MNEVNGACSKMSEIFPIMFDLMQKLERAFIYQKLSYANAISDTVQDLYILFPLP